MNDDKRRYVPWSRETDKTAAIIAAILALLGGDILSSTGAVRVGKFTRSDFDREIALRDSRMAKLEDRIPDKFPPSDWEIKHNTWQNGVQAQLDAIRVDDRAAQKRLDQIYDNCTRHNEEAEVWKRKIEQNATSINNLWQWYQQRMNK